MSISISGDKEFENIPSIKSKALRINLNENILPTKKRANLILKKNINHEINEIWLRNT